MKSLPLLFTLIFLMSACTKNETTPTTQPVLSSTDSVLIGAGSTVVTMGNFMNGVHTTMGNAAWHKIGTQQTIYLSNFSTDVGPDLKVYLSKDINASSFILLGDLKSFAGNQTYTIPSNTASTDYKYVLIWCQRFTVLFGSARLQ